VACLLLGTAEVHVADVAVENLRRRLMCLAREMPSQFRLELEVKTTLLTIKLVAMRHPVMMLGRTVRLMLLRHITLVLTRLTIELFQFLLTFLLHGLATNASGETGMLDAMLVGSRQAVERLSADTRAVGRESTPAGPVLGEVERHAGQILAREPEPAEVAPTVEETFRILDDVRQGKDAPVDVEASSSPKVEVGVMYVGQGDRVGLGLQPGIIVVDVRARGVGDVHFLPGEVFFCRFLCLNPSLPPYLRRSCSSPLPCVS